MPKLFDLLKVPYLEVEDLKIPTGVEFVSTETVKEYITNLEEFNIKLTGRRKVTLFDSFNEMKTEEPLKPVVDDKSFHQLTTGTEIAIANIPSTTSGTTFINGPFVPQLKTTKVIKKNKSDKAVIVSIKDQLKKKTRRKLAAASKRKNR